MLISPCHEGASCYNTANAPLPRSAQAVLGEFEQRAEQLAAQLAGAQAAQQLDVPHKVTAQSSGCSMLSAAGDGAVPSAAGSRRASEELSRHCPAAGAAEAAQAGDLTELQQEIGPRVAAIDGESRAVPDAGCGRSLTDGDNSCSPQGSWPAAACLGQAAAGEMDDPTRNMPLHAHIAEHPPNKAVDLRSCEQGDNAAEAGPWLASGQAAAPAEDCMPQTADYPESCNDATADESQHMQETIAELVPLPWVGSPRNKECEALPAVQARGIPEDTSPAAVSAACHEDQCMPVPMVSVCSSPPALRPVKRARWSELQTMRCTMEEAGTAGGVDCSEAGSGQRSPSGDATEPHREAQRDDMPERQLCFEGPEHQVVAPSAGEAASDAVLPTVETLTERLEGLSGLVMGQDGGSQIGSHGSPSAVHVGIALQGAARYVPWGECTPP